MSYCVGFEPIFDAHSRVLVLGSFPSVLSRRQAFYYGNPRNRFWSVLAEAFGEEFPQTIADRKNLCLNNGVALWDIVADCEIEGSMDSDIRNLRTVDLRRITERCPLQKILCNGLVAYKLTVQTYTGSLPVVRLPSTSPANVRFDKEAWLNDLKV